MLSRVSSSFIVLLPFDPYRNSLPFRSETWFIIPSAVAHSCHENTVPPGVEIFDLRSFLSFFFLFFTSTYPTFYLSLKWISIATPLRWQITKGYDFIWSKTIEISGYQLESTPFRSRIRSFHRFSRHANTLLTFFPHLRTSFRSWCKPLDRGTGRAVLSAKPSLPLVSLCTCVARYERGSHLLLNLMKLACAFVSPSSKCRWLGRQGRTLKSTWREEWSSEQEEEGRVPRGQGLEERLSILEITCSLVLLSLGTWIIQNNRGRDNGHTMDQEIARRRILSRIDLFPRKSSFFMKPSSYLTLLVCCISNAGSLTMRRHANAFFFFNLHSSSIKSPVIDS